MFNIRYRSFIIVIILLMLTVSGCSQEDENPEQVLENYIGSWMDEDFAQMYENLSSDSKKYISKEDFINRYENIYSGINGQDLVININEDLEFNKEDTLFDLAYSFKMSTLAGVLEFDHSLEIILEEGQDTNTWKVKWDESLIFPGMIEGDTVRVVTSPATRGRIIDTNGISIADNGQIRSIGIVVEDLGDEGPSTKEALANAFNMTLEDVNSKLEANWVQPHLFVPIASLALEEEDKAIELTSLPGVLAQRLPSRVYPLKEAAAHLIGYIGNISGEELDRLEGEGYNQNSIIGKSGLELIYEEKLRANDGKAIHILDRNNLLKEILVEKEAKDGQDIQVTIDSYLQRKIYEEIGNEKGTAVAMNPKTGHVLALVNKPAYNPNSFVLGMSPQEWKDLNEDEDRPLMNRFTQISSPGSVFKPITAAIGLEYGDIDPQETIDISGFQWQKDPSWGNYYITRVSDPGKQVNLRDGLVYSDNIYFAQMALKLGEETFTSGASQFAIGQEIDFEYPISKSQIHNDGSSLNEILLADSGYGQGEVELSPLHLTSIYTTFLNKGHMIKPVLLKENNNEPILWKKNLISESAAEIIKESLVQVIESPQGTGRLSKIQGRTIGGKTGTAELKLSQGDQGQNNGWFIAFDSQYEHIILTIMLEDVDGSSLVIPKVRNVLESYLP